MSILIRNGRLIDPSQNLDQAADLLIRDGKIGTIAEPGTLDALISGDSACQVVDASGCWVVPGLIDLHVHFREPGQEYKEDIRSGCEAAAAGGFTTVCCMPNTKPVVDCVEIAQQVLEKGQQANGVHVLTTACITKGQAGKELVDYLPLKDAGVTGFSEDGRSVKDLSVMREAMQRLKTLDMPVMDHTEQPELVGRGGMHQGSASERAGLEGTPPETEELMTIRDILLAKETGCRLHLQHISTRGSLELIRLAKSMGLPVTAETAPHYFTLTDEDVIAGDSPEILEHIPEEEQYHYTVLENGIVLDTHRKMNPPLRSREDRQAMVEALKDGTIDILSTDHAPHAAEEKAKPFQEAPYGVTGLETSFAVSYTELVKKGQLSPLRLIEMMSTKPAMIAGCLGGSLRPGSPADVAVIDVEKTYRVSGNAFRSRAVNTPFEGRTVNGKVRYTIADGRIIYKDADETMTV